MIYKVLAVGIPVGVLVLAGIGAFNHIMPQPSSDTRAFGVAVTKLSNRKVKDIVAWEFLSQEQDRYDKVYGPFQNRAEAARFAATI